LVIDGVWVLLSHGQCDIIGIFWNYDRTFFKMVRLGAIIVSQ
jgi:hypothetical protein